MSYFLIFFVFFFGFCFLRGMEGGLVELENVAGNGSSGSYGREEEMEMEMEDLKEADDEQQYLKDWQDPESDDEIVLPAARIYKNETKRKMTIKDLMEEGQKRYDFFAVVFELFVLLLES